MINEITAYLGIGANLGNRQQQLKLAVAALRSNPVIQLKAFSKVYQTKAVADEDQPDYLNAVLAITTSLTVTELLVTCLNLEKQAGRIRTKINAARELDIDILLVGQDVICDQQLQVPHPKMLERAFVLVPLNDIAPDVIHPIVNKPISALVKNVADQGVEVFRDASFWEETEGVTSGGR